MSKEKAIIQIPLSKSKNLLLLLGSITFVVIGIWFIYSYIHNDTSLGINLFLLAILGGLSILFFGACAIFVFSKLLDKNPGLIIDNTSIIDNSSGFSSGKILWSDIQNMSISEIHKQKLIMLHLKNPQDYIDAQTNFIKRKGMMINYKMYGTPISITSNGLEITFDELLAVLVKEFEMHKSRE